MKKSDPIPSVATIALDALDYQIELDRTGGPSDLSTDTLRKAIRDLEVSEERPKIEIVDDEKLLKQWGHKEPVVQVSTERGVALFPASSVLPIYNYLLRLKKEGQ